MIKAFARELEEDWEDSDFQIYADEEDLIIIEFSLDSLDNPKGLLAYMNHMNNNLSMLSEFRLTKMV